LINFTQDGEFFTGQKNKMTFFVLFATETVILILVYYPSTFVCFSFPFIHPFLLLCLPLMGISFYRSSSISTSLSLIQIRTVGQYYVLRLYSPDFTLIRGNSSTFYSHSNASKVIKTFFLNLIDNQ
jgi:hypothetical protein